MLRAATVLLCLSVSGAPAAQVFKCVKQGKVTYSEAPCPGAQVTQLALEPAAPDAPPRPDPQAELQRQKALADSLAGARQAREAQDERQRASAARAARVRHQHCEQLRLQKKWADEDARGARDGDQAHSLRKKAQRAAESLKAECPG